jgi:hypothetical protein
MVMAGIRTEMGWQEEPALQEFVDRSRLNLLSGWEAQTDGDTARALQGRFFGALFPALEKLQVFAAQATTRERARMFEPAASADA